MTTKTEKAPNYSDADVEMMLAVYDPQADQDTRIAQVAQLASDLGRKTQSIVSKLVSLKVYVKKVTIAKDGKPTMSKQTRVDALATKMGILPELFESLTKSNVSVIKAIDEAITQGIQDAGNLASVMESAREQGVTFEGEETEEG